MKKINPNLYPKDGHYYKESDGTTIRADTWPGVVVRVAAYRRRAGYAPGNPAVEVVEQACSRNPVICNDDSNNTYEMAVRKSSLKSRVLGWMALARTHKAQGRIEYVDAQTAVARAQICAGCPFNQSLQEGCASCRQAQAEMRKEILGRRPLDARLNGCLVLGEDMQTAAHLERETTENAELPGHCWRKRTI
jgi:hypothetical protein